MPADDRPADGETLGALREWSVVDNGQQLGPFSLEGLRLGVANDYIGSQAQVWDGQAWVNVHSFLAGFVDAQPTGTMPIAAAQPELTSVAPADELMNLELVEAPPTPPPPEVPVFASRPDEVRAVALSDAPPPERDRIVLIGRRAAGKTVYLARLYERLWRGTKELSMKALSGPVHREMMHVVDTLQKGQWPPATVSSMHMELEVYYQGHRQVMVALDYAGELFRKAFVDERSDDPEVRDLLAHIDRAAAVIVLADPAVMIGADVDAVVDDDFGIVQAVQRVRQWPGGENVPIVLVLTKYDQNKRLLGVHRSRVDFVHRYFPALCRQMENLPIIAVSAAQIRRTASGEQLPKPDSVPVDVERPLLYCMKEIIAAEGRSKAAAQTRAEQERAAQLARQMEHADRRRQITLAVLVASLIFVAACIIVLIIVYRG